MSKLDVDDKDTLPSAAFYDFNNIDGKCVLSFAACYDDGTSALYLAVMLVVKMLFLFCFC
jgi:hypothetical protein